MSDLLSDLDGVVCMIDDILVHGRTVKEHDKHLVGVLHRLEQPGTRRNVSFLSPKSNSLDKS